MDTSKKSKKMNRHDVLQHIPIDEYLYDDEGVVYNYCFFKECFFDSFVVFESQGCSVRQSVNGTFYYGYDVDMDENGMKKFVGILSGILFEIEKGEVDPELAFGAEWDIRDFETGNYDDLFSPEDLELIRVDIKKIKQYLFDHPEILASLPPLED